MIYFFKQNIFYFVNIVGFYKIIHKLLFWNNKKEAFYFTIFTCTIIALCIVKKDLQQLHFGCVQPLFLQHLVEIRKKNFYISYLAFF